MRNRMHLICLAVALSAAACDTDASGDPPDGAAPGAADAGATPDAAPQDAAAQDAAAQDAAPPDAAAQDAAAPDAAPPPGCAPRDGVELTTSDGVRLVGDLAVGGAPDGRGVVLLHMIPPGNTRRNYPVGFIEALTARGFVVLNLDRRGAGDSDGTPRDAYEGPLGRNDPEAAHRALAECGVDPARVACVGASNGTTSCLDYALTSPEDLPPLAAMVFLTGGGYTENQHGLAAARPALAALPLRFVFSTAERAWSAGFQADAPPAWSFDEYAGGDHGTRMFTAAPQSAAAVAEWLDQNSP